jgi:hypothetical protein
MSFGALRIYEVKDWESNQNPRNSPDYEDFSRSAAPSFGQVSSFRTGNIRGFLIVDSQNSHTLHFEIGGAWIVAMCDVQTLFTNQSGVSFSSRASRAWAVSGVDHFAWS